MALVFLLDTSGSMGWPENDPPIRHLNDGLNRFKTEVSENKQTRDILDVAIVEFNSNFRVVQDFVPVEYMESINLVATGGTTISPAIREVLKMVDDRSRFYRRSGSEPYKPWVLLISDGQPSDDITAVAQEIKAMEDAGKVSFRSLSVGENDSETLQALHQLSGQKVMKMKGTNFSSFFDWVNKSMRSVSQSSPGERPKAEKLSGNVVVDTDWD
jgi:uncharacterized protein YegL